MLEPDSNVSLAHSLSLCHTTSSPFASSLSAVKTWISVNGQPARLSARKKSDVSASASVEVKEGDKVELGYGDWRTTKFSPSYVVIWTVDGRQVWTDITSKASTFWRSASDDVTRIGFAKTTKPGRPHYLLDMPESSASTATRSSRSLKKVVSVSYYDATGLQGNSYKLKHPDGKPVGTVEFTVSLAPLSEPPFSMPAARPTLPTAPFPAIPPSQKIPISTSTTRTAPSAEPEAKVAPIPKSILSSYRTISSDGLPSLAPSSPSGEKESKEQKIGSDAGAMKTMAGPSSSDQLTGDDVDFEHERAMLELEEEDVALMERKLAVRKRKLMLNEGQRTRQRRR